MQSLIVGVDSKLGQALGKEMTNQKLDCTGTSRRGNGIHLDMMEPDLTNIRPSYDVVYILAAITKVVDCESLPAMAWRVNADAPVTIARWAAVAGAHTVFLSSDAVERAPNLVYSRAKAYAELGMMGLGATIVRPAMIGTPERFEKLARKLIELGRYRTKGLVRWN
jgi:dTDP-4-dehydrorhamnose reductase